MIRLLCCVLTLTLLFTACKKDDSNDQDLPKNTFCTGANASIIIANSQKIGSRSISSVSAEFTNGLFFSSNANAGLEVGTLTVQGRNVPFDTLLNDYKLHQLATAPYSGSITVSLTGGNGYSAFTHTTTNTMPTMDDFTTSSDTIYESQPFTVMFNNVAHADSITFMINGPGVRVVEIVEAGQTSYTFAAGVLTSPNSSGDNDLLVVAYNRNALDKDGKKICMQLNKTQSKSFPRRP